ncbi:MAG TPA: DUF397 domain-containing protein [Stackebrandtia sp.]|uniref:DUF397 domain-containing protein n=1 Tax=Stackebrandtia sp. TaxID=2023065 RepID=UPI002D689C3D|nr:DUF397 domain-containing protein [Stackebrandtia sp.]HZE40229.1 DUF397 domain-containing protein [Stackebrandtia sp.]
MTATPDPETPGPADEDGEYVQYVAMRDSKLPTDGDFPMLEVEAHEWMGMIRDIKSGVIPNPHEGACPPPPEE